MVTPSYSPPVAFKEWAAVCLALADGQQSVILRKGGIAEVGGDFQPEHTRFWLYPTHFHEVQAESIRPEHINYLKQAEAEPRQPGMVTLTHVATVTETRWIDNLDNALSLANQHILTAAAIEKRYHYRKPGLFALFITVEARTPITITETPEYAGCKTWVMLQTIAQCIFVFSHFAFSFSPVCR